VGSQWSDDFDDDERGSGMPQRKGALLLRAVGFLEGPRMMRMVTDPTGRRRVAKLRPPPSSQIDGGPEVLRRAEASTRLRVPHGELRIRHPETRDNRAQDRREEESTALLQAAGAVRGGCDDLNGLPGTG